MKFLLSHVSSGVEIIMGGLQARVLSFIRSFVLFVQLGLPFIASRGVPVKYPIVPYKCGVLIIQMVSLSGCPSPHCGLGSHHYVAPCRSFQYDSWVPIVDSRVIITLHPVLSILFGGCVSAQNPTLPNSTWCPIRCVWGVIGWSACIWMPPHIPSSSISMPFMMS
jgi:hypothetical protein